MSVPEVELHRWTLQFVHYGSEEGFVKSRTVNVVSGLLALSILLLLGVITSLVIIIRSDLDYGGNLEAFHYGMYADLVVVCIIACFTLIGSKTGWIARFGPAGCEIFGCAVTTSCMVLVSFSEPYYMSRLLGYNPYEYIHPKMLQEYKHEVAWYSDSRVLLSILGFMISSHFVLPIRWKIMIVVQVSGVVMYIALFSTLGSAEVGILPFVNTIILTMIAIAMSLGKRRMEWHERFYFVTIIKERSLRCESEFKLARIGEAGPSSSNDGQESVQSRSSPDKLEVESGRTASIFEGLEDEQLDAFEAVLHLGRKEHWLIEKNEVTLLPESLLGAGGFGVVVAGIFEGVLVAVKVSRFKKGRESLTREAVNELRVLRHVRHPNIVLFNGACIDSDSGRLVLVLEYVNGSTLHEFIGRPQHNDEMHPLNQRYQLLIDVCCALRYLHSRTPKIVHGDLKSSNVMVEAGPRAKLLDFGLSRLITARAKPLGLTLRWCAPELLSNRFSIPSRAVDVYSFGLLARFIAAGEEPFEGLQEKLIRRLVSAGVLSSWSRPSTDLLAVHSTAIVELCLSVDPRKRPSMRNVFEILALWPEELHFEPIAKSSAAIAAWHVGEARSAGQHFHTLVENLSRSVPSSKTQKLKQDPQPQEHEQASKDAYPSSCRRGKTTPRPIQYLMIIDSMHRWSFEVDHTACCKFHHALSQTSDIINELRCGDCHPTFTAPADGLVQCPSCGAFDLPLDDAASFQCFLCGANIPSEVIRLEKDGDAKDECTHRRFCL